MNVCIIGDGLSSLSFANNLINKKINVHIYRKKKKNNLSLTRSIGISKNNLNFFNKEIIDIEKENTWEINKIEVYSEKLKNDKILNFEKNKNNLFYIIKNNYLYKLLNNRLLKSKLFKDKVIRNDYFYEKLLKEKKYDLIINCDSKNLIAKKFFLKRINKNYNNLAYTGILKHQKLKNNSAIQIFTKYGPIAFLPISATETSIVYSLDMNNHKYDKKKIINLIKKYNPKFKIKKISKLDNFELKASNIRHYYYNNILAFGDCLHTVHPLAGQGFNMTIRDIKVISKIIQNKIDLGLQLDSLIFEEFEKKVKHKNFIFSNGIDFIYEFFNFDKKNENNNLNKVIKILGKNKILNDLFVKYADIGLGV
jgi:2-octaprenyl-6-methoxyphenol hydroxylase